MRAAISLNKVTGINQVIIGATFVSVATTLPEVFVSIFAVSAGNHGIAVGNAIGAMIANVALVLAISLAFMPQAVKRRDIFGKAVFLLLITGVVFLFALDLKVSWYEGAILIAAFIVFLILTVTKTQRAGQKKTLTEGAGDYLPQKEREKESPKKVWLKIALGFVFGQLMLITGAFALVENGEKLAHILGISETVVGFTVIAIGTSLPELTAAIISIRRKSGGLAIGNVIGANVINCTLLLGVCGIIGGVRGDALPVSRETVFIAIPILFVLTLIAVLPLLIRGKASRWQGVVLLTAYLAYVGYLVVAQPL